LISREIINVDVLNFSTMAADHLKLVSGRLAIVPGAHDCVLSTVVTTGIEQLVERLVSSAENPQSLQN